MANAKPEDSESSIWQGYALQPPTSTSAHSQTYDTGYQPAPLAIPYHGRPTIPTLQTRPPLRDDNTVLTTSPQTLNSHHSYPSLKRAFDGGNEMGYMENVQEYREDIGEMQKPSISQDHRLLSFGRLPDKHTLIDSAGRVKQIDLAAQIHGMFFLSELATSSTEHVISQPELTCYRRNLFQISGNVTAPRGPIFLISERGERIPIISLEANVSATESVDGHTVKLIVIPWKTPPPNSPDVPAGQEQEPAPVPLVAFDEGGPDTANGDFTVFPIAYRRLQFRIATANNGRRRELQQHFMLHLNVVGTLANGAKLNVSEHSTAPIVVRGRSPRNFQARKEIPLVGSSSSRGHPPELHVTTGMMSQSPVIPRRATIPKPGTVELPRGPFTFDSSTISGSPLIVRQSSYPQWSNSQTPMSAEQNTNTSVTPQTPSSYPASAISLDTYLQPAHLASPQSHHSLPRSATLPMARPSQSHYAFPAPAPMSFHDSNPRPAKSPRHAAPPDLPGTTRFASPYANSLAASVTTDSIPPLSRITSTGGSEFFPAPHSMPISLPMSMPMALPPAWAASSNTSTGDTGNVYGGQTLPGIAGCGTEQHSTPPPAHYGFSSEQSGGGHPQGYGKHDMGNNADAGHYTWTNP